MTLFRKSKKTFEKTTKRIFLKQFFHLSNNTLLNLTSIKESNYDLVSVTDGSTEHLREYFIRKCKLYSA